MVSGGAKPRASATAVAAEALLRAEEALALNKETHEMVRELHSALMKPSFGYDQSFMARAMEVILEAEAGKIVGVKLVWYAKLLGALGAIGTAVYTAMHWGPMSK